MYIFGGIDRKNSLIFDDLWELKLDTFEWSQLDPKGYKVTPRFLHSVSVLENYVFIYGGKGIYYYSCFH